MNGHNGKMLFVNLTDGTFEVETFDDNYARTYLGGYGFGAKVLLERMPKNVDAFAPESMLGFITGPTNATGPLFGGRYTVVSKSPVNGGWNDANSGGYFGPALKRSGFDAVFVYGISEKPVYLYLHDDQYELRDASHLWGKDAKETWDLMKEEIDDSVRIATIGQAGENMLYISAIMNDGHRAAGRGGSAAVMGSKKLKAIAVTGKKVIPVGDKETVNALNKAVGAIMKDPPPEREGLLKSFSALGTAGMTYRCAITGDSPVRNWGGSVLDMTDEELSVFEGDVIEKDWHIKSYGCAQCPLRCGAEYNVKSGKWPIGESERPEYETYAAFGTNCSNSDLDAIQVCNELCNRSGLDTISAGSVVAWAMECYENGALTKEDLDGIEANWGNAEAMIALTRKIAFAEGCGKILGNGQKYAADYYDRGHEFEAHVSGIEPGMHDHRLKRATGMGRVFFYDPTPGRHIKGGFTATSDDPNRGEIDVRATATTEFNNAAGFCMCDAFAFPPTARQEYVGAVLGVNIDEEEMINTGKRIFLLRHAFNLREGITLDKQTISKRLAEALKEGPNEGVVSPIKEYGDLFSKALGIDTETGMPTREVLEKIGGLDSVIEILGL